MCNISHFQVIYSWCIQRAKTSGMSIVIRSRKMWKGNLGGGGCGCDSRDNIRLYAIEVRLKRIGKNDQISLQLQKVFWRNKLPWTLFFTASISANTDKRAASADLADESSVSALLLFIYLFIPSRRLCWAFTSNLDFWLGVKIDLLHLPPQHQQGTRDVWFCFFFFF